MNQRLADQLASGSCFLTSRHAHASLKFLVHMSLEVSPGCILRWGLTPARGVTTFLSRKHTNSSNETWISGAKWRSLVPIIVVAFHTQRLEMSLIHEPFHLSSVLKGNRNRGSPRGAMFSVLFRWPQPHHTLASTIRERSCIFLARSFKDILGGSA